ncbi:hypothetical protein QUF75_08295 [Desulfococcaceae bacterium HSG7]|nr:hypothetical protein [Desulfococcaceae bacterium HSG7]
MQNIVFGYENHIKMIIRIQNMYIALTYFMVNTSPSGKILFKGFLAIHDRNGNDIVRKKWLSYEEENAI